MLSLHPLKTVENCHLERRGEKKKRSKKEAPSFHPPLLSSSSTSIEYGSLSLYMKAKSRTSNSSSAKARMAMSRMLHASSQTATRKAQCAGAKSASSS